MNLKSLKKNCHFSELVPYYRSVVVTRMGLVLLLVLLQLTAKRNNVEISNNVFSAKQKIKKKFKAFFQGFQS